MTRSISLGLVLLCGAACGETRQEPVAPSPATPSPIQVAVLSGTVYEHGPKGQQPLSGVPLDISVEYQSWPPQLTSDGQGNYRTSKAAGSAMKVRAEAGGYSQPCRAGAVVKSNDTTLDVHLVSDAVLTTSGIPSSMPIVEPRVTGRIFERTSGGEQPIPGARVVADFTGGDGWAPSATTMSDATGRFLICGADRGLGFGLLLIVSKEGYENADVPVRLAPADSYDIELVEARRTVQ